MLTARAANPADCKNLRAYEPEVGAAATTTSNDACSESIIAHRARILKSIERRPRSRPPREAQVAGHAARQFRQILGPVGFDQAQEQARGTTTSLGILRRGAKSSHGSAFFYLLTITFTITITIVIAIVVVIAIVAEARPKDKAKAPCGSPNKPTLRG